jgi:hypothetical protein
VGNFDTITWQALTAVLTLAGLVGTVVFWRMRGPAAGLRTLALALLPAAAYLTGTLRLLWQIGDAVGSWAVRLTFSPTVWLGIGLAAVSVLLFSVARVMGRRGIGTAARPRPEAAAGPAKPAVEGRPASGKRAARAADADDDMADIEAILKKHGIT